MQPLNVCLLQTATHWHQPQANRDMFEELFARVPPRADLVVLPEMFSTGFSMASGEIAEPMDGATVTWLRQQAAVLGKVVCGSVVISEGGEYFNRFIWMPPDGTAGYYDKRHCFRMAGEHEHYSAGGGKIILQLGAWRVCPLVCYDLRFPVWFRNHAAGSGQHGGAAYDVLLCVANWPQVRQAAWQTLLRARAIENQAYAVGVNITGTDGNGVVYGGGSAVYAPDGEILLELDAGARVADAELDGTSLQQLRKSFPVWQDADRFELLE